MKTHTCKLCGYSWVSRVKAPKCCPQCKRYDWRDAPMSPSKKLVLEIASGLNNGK
jgi:predicted Zn-ribbon and HTH transcriptional regulator